MLMKHSSVTSFGAL